MSNSLFKKDGSMLLGSDLTASIEIRIYFMYEYGGYTIYKYGYTIALCWVNSNYYLKYIGLKIIVNKYLLIVLNHKTAILPFMRVGSIYFIL